MSLTNWQNGLSNTYNGVDEGNLQALTLRSMCELGYTFALINSSRAMVRPFLADGSYRSEDSAMVDACHNARRQVQTSVRHAIEFVRKLGISHAHVLWPAWSQAAFSSISHLILLMAVTSKTLEDASVWVQDLQTARQELRSKSTLIHALRLGVLRIDSLFWRMIANVLKLEPHVREAFTAASISITKP